MNRHGRWNHWQDSRIEVILAVMVGDDLSVLDVALDFLKSVRIENWR